MELFQVLLAIAGVVAPVVLVFVTWLLSMRGAVARLTDRVIERDGPPAPMLRSYMTKEEILTLLRERETEWRTAINADFAAQEAKSHERFRTVMGKFDELVNRIGASEASHQRIEAKIDNVSEGMTKLETRLDRAPR